MEANKLALNQAHEIENHNIFYVQNVHKYSQKLKM